ncbi:hypothetical protein NEMIN01_0913 [Nematocida minor]|uniref:uncharacterized protein n=1 Tax=Nematocida minor TaxID=1912983 RepID=UPI002220660E|nr:uncharacterized protein NEMIN01_0913 [Nematocida minor]KAI5190214.1 hypothetical protein NEMIN01_0913 [Nematocida minor]
MTDNPTLALRKQIILDGPIAINSDFVLIGSKSYPSSTKTTYTNSRDQPYSLASISYLHNTRSLDHGDYIAQCRNVQIDPVSFLDRERILKDLLSPLPLDKITVIKPSRIHPINISRIAAAYSDLKKAQPTGVQCILVPRDDSDIRAVLFNGVEPLHNSVTFGDRSFTLIHNPSDVDSVDRIAAVFSDGSSWQFNDWPSALSDRMKYIPVFYLLLGKSSAPPALPFPATIIRADDSSESSCRRASVAFWSIMGVSSSG